MSLLTPDYIFDTIYDVDLKMLKKEGIKLLLIDIDNTIIPWDSSLVDKKLKRLFQKMKDEGFLVRILSNAPNERVKAISEELNVKGIGRSLKPLSLNFKKSIKDEGILKEQTAMIGDQIFTDLLGAKLAGIKSILVTPLSEKELKATRFMRLLERLVRK